MLAALRAQLRAPGADRSSGVLLGRSCARRSVSRRRADHRGLALFFLDGVRGCGRGR
jgi:hypothetical protein